jgi:hypothetical protein
MKTLNAGHVRVRTFRDTKIPQEFWYGRLPVGAHSFFGILPNKKAGPR